MNNITEIGGKKYAADNGCRLTDCCGCYSTYMDGGLCCKKCYELVGFGEGDGSETLPTDADENVDDTDAATQYADLDVCTECGESIADCPVRRQEGMRPGMCGICNDIAAEIECEECF